MQVLYERCAGIDVHKKSVTVCLVTPGQRGEPKKEKRTFGAVTRDLLALADWLSESGCTHVAIESTGVYWKPVVRHEALCDREGMKGPLGEAVAAVS